MNAIDADAFSRGPRAGSTMTGQAPPEASRSPNRPPRSSPSWEPHQGMAIAKSRASRYWAFRVIIRGVRQPGSIACHRLVCSPTGRENV
ncbi:MULTISPECIES: hypothetical protein [Streptomyces]|uniref:Uncharacterized protein n=1 Tax=Streptomyces yanii TaxID=78510 RepID=A0ABV5RJL3_9ACTN